MPRRAFVLMSFGMFACASGPHPAVEIASKEFKCETTALKLHEIYPRKVRVEGCGKEAIYVKVCSGYGMDSKCGWAVKPD